MATSTRHPALRIDIPTLECDAVMLERLVAASAGSTPSTGAPWLVGLRAAIVAVVVSVLGATTWAAGALAGVDTPFRHHEIQHAPMVPITPTGVTGSPQSGDSSSGGSASAGLPDAQLGAVGRSQGEKAGTYGSQSRQDGATAAGNGPGPVTSAPWPGLGEGNHYGWGKNRGLHHGKHHAYGRVRRHDG